MANVERDNMLNEEQESSQSNSSNGSGMQPASIAAGTTTTISTTAGGGGGGFQLKSSILRQPATFGSGAGAGGGLGLFGSVVASSSGGTPINSFNLKPSVLKPSHFGGFGGFGSGSTSKDQADQSSNNSNSFGGAANPFLKTQASEEDLSSSSAEPKKDDENDGTTTTATKEDTVDPLAKLNRAALPKSNLFANVKSFRENTASFVFGQNVHERVTGETIQSGDKSDVPTAGLSFSSTAATTATGTGATANNSNDSSSSSSAAAAAGAAAATSPAGTGSAAPATNATLHSKPEGDESLEEAARRYEESRGALKRKFDEVETITGEEDERNVMETNCKLFAFANSNWEERGHGMLRLNDKDSSREESRVVFRQAGNLRVLINTKVWSGMTADQSSPKSLRLTAMDNTGQVKVFLVMSRPDVISKLHKELTKRIQTAKEHAPTVVATAEQDEDEAGKENNDDNAVTAKPPSAATVECDDSSAESPSKEPVVSESDEPPCAKKRLSSSS